jgi:hypothetical protein
MIDTVDIEQEIYSSGKRLEEGSKEIFKLAREMAEAERDYRRALSVEIMRLKDEKMQVSLIGDLARGNTADLKFKRDLAEAKYNAARDSLKAISQQMSGLQTIYKFKTEI